MPRQWKCTVCGYVHDGPEPPGNCPRCGADRSEFIPVEEQKLNLLHDIRDSLVLHAVVTHFPGALVPVAVLFFFLSLVTGNPHLEPAAFYLLWVVLAAAPVAIASGIYDWRTRFEGTRALIFYKKIALAAALVLFCVGAVSLRTTYPEPAFGIRAAYGVLLLAMLGCVTLLGHYGGKLAFQWKDRKL